MWSEYVNGKQTYEQLSQRYNCSSKTIKRYLDKVKVVEKQKQIGEVVVLMDTTYFGRTMGVMLFKDTYTGQNLYMEFVKYETNDLYFKGIQELQNRGYIIKAIVCDGRKGLLTLLKDIPIQMCQFHQVAIITRYLTRNPKLIASQELRQLCLKLKDLDRKEFTSLLNEWYKKWKEFLDERSTDISTGKSFYKHKKLRSAYYSLQRNLPWLFVYKDYPKLEIPNTTNAIDGQFADLKSKLRVHNGLSIIRKKKFINEFLKV